MHLNYIFIQTNNIPTNKQTDGYTVVLDESKIGNGGRECINDCSQIWNNFTLQQIHKFVPQMNFIYTITKWYKHMETYHTYANMTPVHNLKLQENTYMFNFLDNYTATLPVFGYEWGKNFQSYIAVAMAGNTYIWAILTLMVFIWFCPKYSSFFFWSDTHCSAWIKKKMNIH